MQALILVWAYTPTSVTARSALTLVNSCSFSCRTKKAKLECRKVRGKIDLVNLSRSFTTKALPDGHQEMMLEWLSSARSLAVRTKSMKAHISVLPRRLLVEFPDEFAGGSCPVSSIASRTVPSKWLRCRRCRCLRVVFGVKLRLKERGRKYTRGHR